MAMLPIGITVELLLNGTWVPITQYVYQRDGLSITGGRQDWGTKASPAQCTFTVNNADGRFSPLYSGGAYFPWLKRNVQIRIGVTATSSSGAFYSGYRFYGEISRWPPLSDISGRDVYVQVTASGPLRRIRAGGGKGSALTRYYNTLDGAYAPVAYWPCEQDPDADVIGAGIEGGQDMAVLSGTPTWKAVSDFNGSAPVGVLNGSVWDGLTGSFGTSGDDIFLTPGAHTWIAPQASVNVKAWGAGGGGDNFLSPSGGKRPGGGGEFAQEATMAFTPGQAYTVNIGAGGQGATNVASPTDGGDTWIAGDAVTLRAHGGKKGGAAAGLGGTGSTNSVHHDGGPGGNANGGGSGGSGGTAAAGNTGGTGAAPNGAAAVTGGGPGGTGSGSGGTTASGPASGPGGGGGGNNFSFASATGGPGYAGKAEFIYTPATAPPNNIIRFILLVPAHGGNRSKVLVRALTSGTIATLDVSLNSTSTGLVITGKLSGGSTAFTGTLTTPVNGVPLLVSAELNTSGANIAWALKAIEPGHTGIAGAVSGTYSTAAVGNVSEVLAGPNGDITKTALGHISVQYAFIDIRKVSAALHGHAGEMTVDRFIRLCNEQALAANPQFAETSDHWGFETGTQSWVPSGAAIAQSPAWSSDGSNSLLIMTSFLSGQNSGFEGGIGTWTGAGNCNVAATSAQAHAGTGALQMTSVASGNMDAAHCTAANILTQGLACASGNTISLSAWFRSAVSTRNCQVGATFYTSGGVLISTLLAAGGVTSSTTGWTQVTGTVTAPATSAFCRLDLRVNATGAANEVHYADDAAISNNSTLTQWYAGGPSGTGGEPCNPGDTVSAAADVYTPAALGALALHIDFYVAAGTYLSSISPATVATAAGDVTTVKATGTVPATAAFLRCTVIDIEASAAGTLMYADHVRITPRMGPQTAKEYHHFLQEIETLDQGILTEDRTTWGLGLRTRFSLVAQAPAVTLDYNMLSPPLEPVVDDQRTVNDVILKRHKGSQVRITNTDASSPMNIQPPPIGVDKKVSITKVIAESDAQLLRLAQHLLNLGTVTDERFPTVTVNLARAGIAGNAMAPLMPAIAAVEVGDRIQATGLPFYYPSATLDQMVIGYQERINPREWVITWNCIPQSPFSLSATTSGRW